MVAAVVSWVWIAVAGMEMLEVFVWSEVSVSFESPEEAGCGDGERGREIGLSGCSRVFFTHHSSS